MSYKQNAAANRDALFGGASSKKKKKQPNAPTTTRTASKPSSAAPTQSTAAAAAETAKNSGAGYMYGVKTTYGGLSSSSKPSRPTLSGEARVEKLKQAEEYRKQAKKCMGRGVFAKPDIVAASMYYKRAAEAYQLCGGEARLERIHRIASADCQARQGAYATAAAEYLRAAELVEEEESKQEMGLEERRNEGARLYLLASENFAQMGEASKAGKYKIQSAMAWMWEDDSNVLSKKTIVALEESIEGFCPDLLNRNQRYRQTGVSAFANPEHTEPTAEDVAMAKHHLVTTSYAHEPLLELVYVFVQNREFPSAMYAVGAASAILQQDGISTLTLARVFCLETILLLAMGDPVGAEQCFLNVHVQHTSYLSSRECRLSEDLFRAILQRDADALEETRSSTGPNRAALAHLHPQARDLVLQLRVSGVAKKKTERKTNKTTQPQSQPMAATTTANPETEAPPPPTTQSVDDLHAEMDDLLNDMGLGSDTESEQDHDASDDDDDDDDDLDLR